MLREIGVVLSIVAFVVVTADIANLNSCDIVGNVCTVNQLRITPCRSRRACILKKGTNVSMSFDYTPNFSTTKLKTAVYWADTGAIFPDLGIADGCTLTTCPVVSGQDGTLNYHLVIGKKLPVGTYIFKWILWNEDNEEQQCCFKTPVQIRKFSGASPNMSYYFLLFVCLFVTINCEYVTRKICKEVDNSQCRINYVTVDPCLHGPRFCNIKTDKIYDIDVNFTPYFTAESLRYAIYGDVGNMYTFDTIIDEPRSACDSVDCPLRRDTHTANFKLKLDKRASGKFPVKVKFWNQDDESQVCCFTFNVKSNNLKVNEI
ncbi:uncharacterized protein LOC131855554 [Achroia grisella]|uniref:uncharacterized protein LOC131855554 n=1 Tax=Achroia grisella TaxID=688607 RepID=UPI0027D3447B|nr:uncharacterized protein LOC131855554 [Achroia grisella]